MSSLSGTSLRVATGAGLLAAVLLALYAAPPPLWTALVLLFLAAAAWEWARLLAFGPLLRHLYAGATALVGVLLATGPAPALPHAYVAAAAFWAVLAPLWLARLGALPGPGLGWLAGWVVLLPAGLALVYLRGESPHLLLAFIALTAIADSAAYFAGRAFGRRKLAPRISPGKTREGALGAAAAVAAYGLLLALFGPWACDLGCIVQVVAGCLILFVLSVEGDLLESWIKRRAGVKDSGAILPGHGGVLDRVDSHLAVLPVAALLWMWLRS